MPPGPAIGATLRHLLEYVLDEPAHNQRETLLAEAARYLNHTAESRS
jgi:hypothetical protein